jgi:hypothetical protein
MANTLNDLYLKYVNSVGASLEDDRYFQYLFQMVQAGSNVLQQKHQVLHKVVDERWLTIIEDSLDAINTIIEKPRRFVTTSEEVVPVALAKKITADSVRHLSMNTQFIASNEEGDIQPTRVLNVTTEESYDLYENRFIYHLIQRLVTFIDKRTDVIFWSTGDETKNTLSFESKVDDAYEEISYKLEMTIKNRQSFAENDSDNMSVFMRIDRVRRMVLALRKSSFCSLMAGCAKVRSPIQRTNLMMKDPNYRTCYKLWQFLESYDEVGYAIDVQDSALEFDEEYLFQLYTNFITNYAVFQSILEQMPRKLEETKAKKRKYIKPKFIKKVKEQIVDNYDLPDVEIRRVFVEEVTQAQLDAEEKLTQETKARQTAESAVEDLTGQMGLLQQQLMALQEMSVAAEEQADQERKAKEEALSQLETQTQAAQQAQELLELERQARKDAENLAQRESQARQEAQTQADAAVTQAQEKLQQVQAQAEQAVKDAQAQAQTLVDETKAQAEAAVTQAQTEAAETVERTQTQARTQVEKAQADAKQAVAQAQTRAETEIAQTRDQTKAQLAQTKSEAAAAVTQAQTQADAQVKQAQNVSQREIEKAQADAQAEIRKAKAQAEAEIAQMQAKAQAEIEKARQEAAAAQAQAREAVQAKTQAQQTAQAAQMAQKAAEAAVRSAEAEAKLQRRRAEKEAKAREKAQEKADANSLSKYIITALNGRKAKGQPEQPEDSDDHE